MLRRRLAYLSVFAFTLACSSDTTGVGSGGDGDGDGTAESGTGDPSNTETSGTMGTTGDGDGDPTTTGDGDGDPTTTGDGDGDMTTTGDGDGDGDMTTGDGDMTTGDGDGDAVWPYYGACPMNQDDECHPSEYCLDQAFENWQVCTTVCESVADCPEGPPGTSITCAPISANIFNKGCFINCADDPCPDGMYCEPEGINHDVCVFDV